MTAVSASVHDQVGAPTPTDRLLTGALVVGPVLFLAADSLYAAAGWDDATAGVFHVLGAIGYGLAVLRVATWLPPRSRLAAVLMLIGVMGVAGNAAYGFEAIHMSFGDTALVDQPGPANLIKPLGLLVPLAFALVAVALNALGRRWQAAVVLVAAIAWPVAHIGNIASLAVAVNLVLVVAFGSLTWVARPPAPGAPLREDAEPSVG